MAEAFERIVQISPAFDKRAPEPHKNYGIGAVEIRMVLKGPLGATQFLMSTGWYLPHVAKELEAKGYRNEGPRGWDVGYHAPTPQYEGQSPVGKDCEFITGGGPCYYDGSSLAANPVLETLISEGSEAVWRILEERYREQFEALAKQKGE